MSLVSVPCSLVHVTVWVVVGAEPLAKVLPPIAYVAGAVWIRELTLAVLQRLAPFALVTGAVPEAVDPLAVAVSAVILPLVYVAIR